MTSKIRVGKKNLGLSDPTYFVADIAANHDGDLERAKDLIYLCAEAGANAAKFQNFLAESIVSDYGFKSLGDMQSHQKKWGKSVYEVYDEASLPLEWTKSLKSTCDEAGIEYLTTPYAIDIIDILAPHVCAWKLGSGDITWHALIERLAQAQKPLFIATGASDMAEVHMAMNIVHKYTKEVVLMQCNTNYTASVENFHHIALNVLKTYSRLYPKTILGLSDHTPGHATVLGAVTLGARVIEKHFTDDTTRKGPDHKFSMDYDSWKDMVDRTRELEAALGGEEKRVMENENETVILQRRAIRASKLIKKGETITEADLSVLRPCPPDALPPYRIEEVIGTQALHDIKNGEIVRLTDVESA